jgi:ABC-type antimicrobial peptide transport system ATPase subunit
MTQLLERPAVREPRLEQQVPVLQVRRLTTEFKTHAGPLRAVNDMSFSLERGRVLAIIGGLFSASNRPARAWRARSCSTEWTS